MTPSGSALQTDKDWRKKSSVKSDATCTSRHSYYVGTWYRTIESCLGEASGSGSERPGSDPRSPINPGFCDPTSWSAIYPA